ncbi:MAG: hypothetical protein HY301_01290 [Verrucomicrobia bacterium]|nr:hypothetical protein [Verrucomicrobiota bacterium]
MKPISILTSLLVFARTLDAQTASPDLAQLTRGVTKIASPGTPGRVCVFGDTAFPIVVGGAGKGLVQPVVGAGRLGAGRVVVFGHGGYFDAATMKEGDSGKFLANCITWAARGAAKPEVVVLGGKGVSEGLISLGFAPVPADLAKLSPKQVLFADASRIKPGDVETIVKFIRAGGGWITAGTGWGWKQLNPGKELGTDLIGNRILHLAGVLIADGTSTDTTANGFTVGGDIPLLAHAGRALSSAIASTGGAVKLSKSDAALASASLVGAMESLPANDTQFLPRLRSLAANPKVVAVPSAKTPVKSDNFAGRMLVTMQGQSLRKLAPEQTRAHPAAEFFPGPVPKTAARLASASVSVDTKIPAWHSTGLYAAPGELITVTVPAEAAKKKLRVRIGSHTDHLWQLDSWKRFPEISREFPLDAAVTRAANAFGGLIYIEVPNDSALGRINVTIQNAVAAPRFVLGQTDLATWRSKLRALPAPWAEIEGAKLIVTLPAENVRTLDDPDEVAKYWDRVVTAEDELSGVNDRVRPERFVLDQQISAGYMHSGYPIMAWLDQSDKVANMAALKQGNWGFYHELGHNHQKGDWTFEGTTEVTCNLFSFYIFDKLCGVKPRDYVHGRGEAKVIELHKKYFAGGAASFERWKADPFTALCMYAQLQDAFGWEAYQKVFIEYRDLPDGQRPKSDQDRRDQWMVRFSKTVGKNLAPFFRKWGVPVTDAAAQSVASLPAWMPVDMK